MTVQVYVLDYGAGNMYSIIRGLQRVGIEPSVVTEPSALWDADAVVIPGVGNFSKASQRLSNYESILYDLKKEGRHILGICLGMQVMLDRSEEGNGSGLGLIPGAVKRLPSGVKVPHMGWNRIRFKKNNSLFDGLPDSPHLYFVHSYFAEPLEASAVIATTKYGLDFPSVITSDALYGVQFHPEKSGEMGLRILRNFSGLITR